MVGGGGGLLGPISTHSAQVYKPFSEDEPVISDKWVIRELFHF